MIRKITNFSKSTYIQTTFRTNNTIQYILKTLTNNTNTYMRSDIYQLQCHTWHHYYIGLTANLLEQRY